MHLKLTQGFEIKVEEEFLSAFQPAYLILGKLPKDSVTHLVTQLLQPSQFTKFPFSLLSLSFLQQVLVYADLAGRQVCSFVVWFTAQPQK